MINRLHATVTLAALAGIAGVEGPAASVYAAPLDSAPRATEAREAVLIGFDHPVGVDEVAWVESLGGEVRYAYHLIDAIAASLPAGAIDFVGRADAVTYVEPDRVHHIVGDELTNSWGVKRVGGGFAHAAGHTGAGIKVAVIDTGVDYNHPDLAGRVAGGYDFVNNDPDPIDDHDHGTHVAGTIAAVLDGNGVVGVAPEVEIYALKALNAQGSGSTSDLIAAIQWAADNDMDITSNSWGSFLPSGQAMRDAFDNSYDAGVLHVAAAGNFYGLFGVSYPARYESLIAVGATDQQNRKAAFSDTGPELELAAPGVDVNSTIRNGRYDLFSGTSMATPHVSGAAALALASGSIEDTNLNGRVNDEVRDRLAATAIDLGAPGRDRSFGFGLVNASTAVSTPMSLTVPTLVAGDVATLTASGADAGSTVFFVYGAATGPVEIAPLGVVLSILNPSLGGSAVADSGGVASFSATVPGAASGVTIFVQAATNGVVSDVVRTTIQ